MEVSPGGSEKVVVLETLSSSDLNGLISSLPLHDGSDEEDTNPAGSPSSVSFSTTVS